MNDFEELSTLIRFLTTDRTNLAQPIEWQPALIEIGASVDLWTSARLTVQGAEVPLSLRMENGVPRIIGEWPRSGPGNYAISVTIGAISATRVVTVTPHKISPSAFRELLADLETRLPVAIALGLQQTGGLAGLILPPSGETTVAQEYVRLQRALLGTDQRLGLINVLEALAPDPHVVLRRDERWIRADRARRPHPARLRQAIASVDNLDRNQHPHRVLDEQIEPSVDTYENQLVALFVDQVRLRVRRLIRRLGSVESSSTFEVLSALERRFEHTCRRTQFLSEVSRTQFALNRASMVLLKRAPYRAALSGYLELNRSIAIRFEDTALDAPLENLPLLYQIWGTLHVFSAVINIAAELGFQLVRQQLIQRDTNGAYVHVLRDGAAAIVLNHPASGATIRCIPERAYAHGPLHSISYKQRPDVAIEIDRPSQPTIVVIFDPKYKLDGELVDGEAIDGKPKKIDIDKMHAYRDAIRGLGGYRIVASASILYPGPTIIYGQGLEAIHAYPGQSAELRESVSAAIRAVLLPIVD